MRGCFWHAKQSNTLIMLCNSVIETRQRAAIVKFVIIPCQWNKRWWTTCKSVHILNEGTSVSTQTMESYSYALDCQIDADAEL